MLLTMVTAVLVSCQPLPRGDLMGPPKPGTEPGWVIPPGVPGPETPGDSDFPPFVDDCFPYRGHLPPDASLFDTNLIRIQRNVITRLEVTPPSSQERKSAWVGQSACNCAYIPCSQRNTCQSNPRRFGTRAQTCWTIGGEVSVEGKTSLLLQLLGSLQVGVTVSTEFQRCIEQSEEWEIIPPVNDCFDTFARLLWVHGRVNGVVVEADYVFTWERAVLDAAGNLLGYEQSNTECNSRNSTGSVWIDGGQFTQFAPFPPGCGWYDGIPLDNPDTYDNQRMRPCRQCVCEPPPPNGDPCCGCWVGSGP